MITVGTASWTDKSLIDAGTFYPKDCKSPEARLRFYAAEFPMVEVDSSYYGIPSARNSQAWVDRTPADFVFNVKAYRAMTLHQVPTNAMQKDLLAMLGDKAAGKRSLFHRDLPLEVRNEIWRQFLIGVEPLRIAGKLGALHFQLAPWVGSNAGSINYLEEIRERLPGYSVAVEFRNRSWFADPAATQDTLTILRDLQFTNVICDEPQGFDNSIPSVWDVTTPELAIVRLHGRNVTTWNIKDAKSSADRFNYDYAEDELRGIADEIMRMAARVALIQTILNNNYGDQAIRNSRTIRRILGLPDSPGPKDGHS